MLNTQTTPESIQEIPAPDTMTLVEFLENDLEGYEYVKGELVPIPPTSMKHGEISSNVSLHLSSHVFEYQLGRMYIAGTTFLIVAKTVMVYRSETDSTVLNYEDTLTGEDVVEGFSCPVAQLFE